MILMPFCLTKFNAIINSWCISFLPSSKSVPSISKFHGIEFDGVLSFNGSYCFTPNELIYKNPLNKKDIQTFVDNAKKLKNSSST